MNKITQILIFITLSILSVCAASAQSHTIGIKGGTSMGFANIDSYTNMVPHLGNYEGSLVYTYSGFQKYYGDIQTEITYSQRGYRHQIMEDSDTVSTRQISSVEVPFLWRPNYIFSKDRGIVYGVVGMYLYYDISSTEGLLDVSDHNNLNTIAKYKYDSLKDNRLGIGVLGGLGVGWNIVKNLRISAEVRYSYAFSNVLRPASKYEGNPVQSTTSRVSLTFGLSYTIK